MHVAAAYLPNRATPFKFQRSFSYNQLTLKKIAWYGSADLIAAPISSSGYRLPGSPSRSTGARVSYGDIRPAFAFTQQPLVKATVPSSGQKLFPPLGASSHLVGDKPVLRKASDGGVTAMVVEGDRRRRCQQHHCGAPCVLGIRLNLFQ